MPGAFSHSKREDCSVGLTSSFEVLLALLLLVVGLVPKQSLAHESGKAHLHAFGEVGARILDADAFLALRPGIVLHSPSIQLILAPLLHFTLTPEGELSLRSEDFHAPSDFARVVYLLHAEDKGQRWRLEAGSLANQSLGHGSVVNNFSAALDPDAPLSALRMDVFSSSFGVEALGVGLLEPILLAARVHALPIQALGGRGRVSGAWRIGMLGAIDPRAPVSLTGGLDSGRRPLAEREPVAFLSFDTSVCVYSDHRVFVEPYADFVVSAAGPNFGSYGAHSGLAGSYRTSGLWSVSINAEARMTGSGYIAEPFDAFYSLERWSYPVGSSNLKALSNADPSGWGGKLDLEIERSGHYFVGFSVDAQAQRPNHVLLRFALDSLKDFSISTLVALRGISTHELSDLDQGDLSSSDRHSWVWLLESRWYFKDAMYLAARGGRTYRVDLLDANYRPVWDAALMLGFTL